MFHSDTMATINLVKRLSDNVHAERKKSEHEQIETLCKEVENIKFNIINIIEYLNNQEKVAQNGKWIKFKLGDFDFVDRYECSLCGNIILPAAGQIDAFLYCSHCGAKMERG